MSCNDKRNALQKKIGRLSAGVLFSQPTDRMTRSMKTEWGINGLLSAIHSPNASLRLAALRSVSAYNLEPPAEITAAVLASLAHADEDISVREQAVKTASYWASNDLVDWRTAPDILPGLIDTLRQSQDAYSVSAAAKLARMLGDPRIAPALAGRLDDPDEVIQGMVMNSLVALEPRTSDVLFNVLAGDRQQPDEAKGAVTYFYRNPDGRTAFERGLVSWLSRLPDEPKQDELPGGSQEIMDRLADMMDRQPGAFVLESACWDILRGPNANNYHHTVRRKAAKYLAARPRPVSYWAELPTDPDPQVRRLAFRSLGKMKMGVAEAQAAVADALRDEAPGVRSAALEYLSKSPERLRASINEFILAADGDLEPHPAIRGYAVQVLSFALERGLVDPNDRSMAVNAIVQAMSDRSGRVQDAARTAFQSVQDEASTALLRQLLSSFPQENDPRLAAARGMGEAVSGPLTLMVRQSYGGGTLNDEGMQAAEVLIQLGDAAVEPVRRVFLSDPDPMVRAIGVDLLGSVATDAALAVMNEIDDSDPVKMRVYSILNQINGIAEPEFPDRPRKKTTRKRSSRKRMEI